MAQEVKSARVVVGINLDNKTNPGNDENGFEVVHHEDVCEYERVILIIGKTGNGKSSVGNMLLGSNEFAVGRGMASTTMQTESCKVPDKNCKLKVVDTPDLLNADMSEDDKSKEVSKWKKETNPQVHVILLAVRCDIRYTAEEYAVYSEVKRLWGNDTDFCKRLVVGFTFGDRLDGDIQEELKSVCDELQTVLADASNRNVLFNKKAKNEDTQDKREQVFKTDSDLATVLKKPGMVGYLLSCFPEWNVLDSVLSVFSVFGNLVTMPYNFIVQYAWPASDTPESTHAVKSDEKKEGASADGQVSAETTKETRDTDAASDKQCSELAANIVPAETKG